MMQDIRGLNILWGEMFNSIFSFHLLILYTAQAGGREECRRERGRHTNTHASPENPIPSSSQWFSTGTALLPKMRSVNLWK